MRCSRERYKNILWEGVEEEDEDHVLEIEVASPVIPQSYVCGVPGDGGDADDANGAGAVEGRCFSLQRRHPPPPRLWPACGVRTLVIWRRAFTGFGLEVSHSDGDVLSCVENWRLGRADGLVNSCVDVFSW